MTNFKSGCTKLPKMRPLSAGQSHIIKKSNNKALMKDKSRETLDLGLEVINTDWKNLVGTRKKLVHFSFDAFSVLLCVIM